MITQSASTFHNPHSPFNQRELQLRDYISTVDESQDSAWGLKRSLSRGASCWPPLRPTGLRQCRATLVVRDGALIETRVLWNWSGSGKLGRCDDVGFTCAGKSRECDHMADSANLTLLHELAVLVHPVRVLIHPTSGCASVRGVRINESLRAFATCTAWSATSASSPLQVTPTPGDRPNASCTRGLYRVVELVFSPVSRPSFARESRRRDNLRKLSGSHHPRPWPLWSFTSQATPSLLPVVVA